MTHHARWSVSLIGKLAAFLVLFVATACSADVARGVAPNFTIDAPTVYPVVPETFCIGATVNRPNMGCLPTQGAGSYSTVNFVTQASLCSCDGLPSQ